MSARHFEAVVIGASAGSVQALSVILPRLPKNYPLAVMIVVHLPADNKSLLVELFQEKCHLRIKEAEDKEPIQPSTVYFAPPDYHMLVEKDKTLSFSAEEPILFSRPSIDVLFETAADAYDENLIGIILTGANNDGARGLKAVEDAGGAAIVQIPGGAYVATMPQAALEVCRNAKALSLEDIAQYLQKAACV